MARPPMLLLSMPALALVLGGAPESDPGKVRHALAVFSEAPLATGVDSALATIVSFADDSDAVEIVISPEVAPWMNDSHVDDPHRQLLLGAFVAGNLRSQLDSGVKRNDAYAGLLQVFAVYRDLRAAEPSFKVPSVDALLSRHRRGELPSFLASAAAPKAGGKSSGAAAPSTDPQAPGLVPDVETAVRIAVAVWEPIYGKDTIAGEQPYEAKLDGDVWTVTGSLPKGMVGGVAEAHIDREDGRILRVIHGE